MNVSSSIIYCPIAQVETAFEVARQRDMLQMVLPMPLHRELFEAHGSLMSPVKRYGC